MKIIGIIPARYQSTRIINKPLIEINGKPLVQCTYEAALNSNLFDSIYVTTDSAKIRKKAEHFGAQCTMSSKLNRNGTERCVELIKSLNTDISADDLIVNIQCDEPFLKPKHFKKIISLFKKNIEIGTLICPLNEIEKNDNSVVKVKINMQNTALKFQRNITTSCQLYKHIGIYAYKKNTLEKLGKLPIIEQEITESLEQIRWLYYNYKIHCGLIKDNLTSINTYSDIKKVIKIN